ncbi:peptide chain release factor N(5)-glutamine methyltransferase [Nesterenkonia flava]
MELAGMIRRAGARLAEAGVPSPRVDAELLAAHVLGTSRSEVQVKALMGVEASDGDLVRYEALVEERARRIPLQHLTGIAPFRTLELRVGPGAFIPRPETETVVELTLQQLRVLADGGLAAPRVIDLGTGSGAIAAAIAAEFPDAEIHALELSAEAAAWAQQNFENLPHGSARVHLHRGDLRDVESLRASLQNVDRGSADQRLRVSGEEEMRFDVVVSNPPYIPPGMVPTEIEVREHDPELALYGGGEDGLQLPRAVIETAVQLLRPGGWFIVEHAEVQAPALKRICEANAALTDVATHQDLSGRDRATSARIAQ